MAKYGQNIGKSWEIPELNGGFWLGKSTVHGKLSSKPCLITGV
jgi:hypothetical protein